MSSWAMHYESAQGVLHRSLLGGARITVGRATGQAKFWWKLWADEPGRAPLASGSASSRSDAVRRAERIAHVFGLLVPTAGVMAGV